ASGYSGRYQSRVGTNHKECDMKYSVRRKSIPDATSEARAIRNLTKSFFKTPDQVRGGNIAA
ncbi:MAG: hypothetical protein KW802_04295, partial [Candidatus Doudnabacteria bacterium]|nr:hypothetical protein [Candidatus Doudnabacteria bacterium]